MVKKLTNIKVRHRSSNTVHLLYFKNMQICLSNSNFVPDFEGLERNYPNKRPNVVSESVYSRFHFFRLLSIPIPCLPIDSRFQSILLWNRFRNWNWNREYTVSDKAHLQVSLQAAYSEKLQIRFIIRKTEFRPNLPDPEENFGKILPNLEFPEPELFISLLTNH